jgi:dihydrofolate reductase
MTSSCRSVDALVIGRKTFETVLTFDTGPYGEKPVFVLRTRPLASPPLGSGLRGWRDHDSAVLRARLIQRLIITRAPVLIGTGIPLLGSLPRDIALEHVATRQYASGLVQG